MTVETVLQVDGLAVALDSGVAIVEDLGLALAAGEVLGLVGESGSGKTTAALALLGFAQPGARIVRGSVLVAGHDVLAMTESERRRIRGEVVSYVPQDAGQALNPSLRIGHAIADVLRAHRAGHRHNDDVRKALIAVDLPASSTFTRRLPHQLSGGQQQRVTIAMALSCGPPVIVMDEPTTGLDVITQASVLAEVRRLRAEQGAAIVYVSHDLAVVSQLADRIAVMYAGRIVEEGSAAAVLRHPRHPYTRGLVQSVPDHRHPRHLVPMRGTAVGIEERTTGCAFAPRCEHRSDVCAELAPAAETLNDGHVVRCHHHHRTRPVELGALRSPAPAHLGDPLLEVRELRAMHRSAGEVVVAAESVTFTLGRGESLALVGQSGSGKTTVARCLVGLHAPDGGTILLDGTPLARQAGRRTVEQRRRIQYVFQNPFESLNPRRRIGEQLARPGQVLRGLSAADARTEVGSLLEQVRLPARTADRHPHQLSGGERQRVAIARALAAHPDVLVCDEITSALDVSVQAAVLEVLSDLRSELELSVLLITHDLGVVAVAADRVIVLESGAIRETGRVHDVLAAPVHPYTQRLVAAAPHLSDDPAVVAGQSI